MSSTPNTSLLWVSESMVDTLLDYYDYPNPVNGEIIEGYDKDHALRTAKMCAAVAQYLGHDEERVHNYQIACLLHDLGRAGLDHDLFGKIWTWARTQNIPTRPAEWRAVHPETTYENETEAFWEMYQTQLTELGVQTNAWAKEQVEMRLGYARRLSRIIKNVIPELEKNNIEWLPWMEKVTLYYYYPEKLEEESDWVRELGEILVACEQLEAYSNRTRGSDYYNRDDESFADAFNYLNNLKQKGQLSGKVLSAVRHITAEGQFDVILEEARDRKLSDKDLSFLRSLNSTH
jgi:HD domain-containing protein